MLKFITSKILPFILIYLALIGAAVLVNYILYLTELKWIIRYLGIVGTALIIFSFVYSLKKRKIIPKGNAKLLLQIHEVLAWMGALMILVHAGIALDAVIPRMAEFAMLVVVASGLTGKYLLKEARASIKSKRVELKEKNLSEKEIEKELFSLSLLADKMQMWRQIHIPLTMIFAALSLLHIIVTLLFWHW